MCHVPLSPLPSLFGSEHQFLDKRTFRLRQPNTCTSNENNKDSSADVVFSAHGSPNVKVPSLFRNLLSGKSRRGTERPSQPWYRIASGSKFQT